MIKIENTGENFLSQFTDIFTIKKSIFISNRLELVVHKDILWDTHGDMKFAKGIYCVDKSLLIYYMDINIDFFDDETVDEDTEQGTEIIYTTDETLDGKEEDGKKYIYREIGEPIKWTVKLEPIKAIAKNGEEIHLGINHIFESLFKANSNLLTKEQYKALRNYFEEYYPQVLEHKEKINYETLEPTNTTRLEEYRKLVQSQSSNNLSGYINKKPDSISLYGDAEIKKDDLFQLFIKGYDELSNGVNSSAKKFLDCLLIEATNTGLHNALVKLSLNEYMKIRGLKDEKSVRQQVKEDIKALEKIRFEYRENKKGNWLNINLSGGTSGIKNGIIFFRFNEDFFNSFRNKNGSYPFMYISDKIFEINDHSNPHSYNLCKKLHSHKRMNIGKPNEKIISVSALLNACPNIPSYDEVMEKGRQIDQRIITPFERDMDALENILEWNYIDEQPHTYDEFIKSTIQFTFKNYPEEETKKLRKNKNSKKKS